jgi:hypothetical protein
VSVAVCVRQRPRTLAAKIWGQHILMAVENGRDVVFGQQRDELQTQKKGEREQEQGEGDLSWALGGKWNVVQACKLAPVPLGLDKCC